MSDARKPLRLWPGIVIAVLIAVAKFVVPVLMPEALMYSVFGQFAGAALVAIWWLLFSRAAWVERLAGIALMVIGVYVARRFVVDVSIATGAMGFLMYIMVLPVMG